MAADERTTEFLEAKAQNGVGFEEAQRVWQQIIGNDQDGGEDWVQSQAMDRFRQELKVESEED